MKKYLIVMIVSSIAFSFQACNKDEYDPTGDLKNSHRIKQIMDYDESGEQTGKTVLSYEGENLTTVTSSIKDENGNWTEQSKREISYSGSKATLTNSRYSSETDNWGYYGKTEYIIENGLMTEELRFDYDNSQWVEARKWIYQYSGTELTAIQIYFDKDANGNLIQSFKSELFYENSKIVELLEYYKDETDDWKQDARYTFSYSGSNIIEDLEYTKDDETNNWIKVQKWDYTYSGDNRTNSEGWKWDRAINNWEAEAVSIVDYSYNSNGYLSENIRRYRYGAFYYKSTYEYEEGHGNAEFFYSDVLAKPFGDPTLKSASVEKQYIPYYKRMITGY